MLTSGRICPGESPREPPLGCDEVGGQGKMPDGAESNSHRSARFRRAVPQGKVSLRDGVKVFPVGRGHRTGVFWVYSWVGTWMFWVLMQLFLESRSRVIFKYFV